MLGSKLCLENCESVKDRITWTKFIQLMQLDVLHGLPVQCKHYPETKRILENAIDFDRAADGGCDLRCLMMLKFGHMCPRKCHPGDDHGRALCTVRHKLNCQKRPHLGLLLWQWTEANVRRVRKHASSSRERTTPSTEAAERVRCSIGDPASPH
jgi:hypothetical protein